MTCTISANKIFQTQIPLQILYKLIIKGRYTRISERVDACSLILIAERWIWRLCHGGGSCIDSVKIANSGNRLAAISTNKMFSHHRTILNNIGIMVDFILYNRTVNSSRMRLQKSRSWKKTSLCGLINFCLSLSCLEPAASQPRTEKQRRQTSARHLWKTPTIFLPINNAMFMRWGKSL